LSVARERQNERITELEDELADADSDRDDLETRLHQVLDALHKRTKGQP
jgi:predicted RNase H-like nuclease (RuvC/YqgF family)